MDALAFEFPLCHLDCQSKKSPAVHAANASAVDASSSGGVSSSSSQSKSLSPSLDGEISLSDKKSNAHTNSVAALKEWAIVCKAAGDGKQVLLFRKGGIMEYRNGFELKHKHFFLFPTFEHQSMDSIRDEYKEKLVNLNKQQQQQPIAKNKYNRSNTPIKDNSDQNQNFTDIDLFVEITYFSEINDVDKLEKLEKFHIWNDDYVKMRYNYNPKKPLYVLMLRTYKLNDAIKVYNKPEWSGCKSWIQLDLNGEALENCFKNIPSPDFEHLKSISKPCIDDVTFNNLTKELRSII